MNSTSALRVFPRRTSATPTDGLAFVGDPPLFRPPADKVMLSVTFTWDLKEGGRLCRAWEKHYPGKVKIGGPAFDDPGGDFKPGMFLAEGYTITSRGCPSRCDYCLVPGREGALRILDIQPGWNIVDNNLLACPRSHVEAVLDMLGQQPNRSEFTGGIEAARVRRWFADRVARLRLGVLYLAYDRPKQRPHVERAAKMLLDAGGWSPGTARRRIGCYVITGTPGDTDAAAVERFEWVKSLGITPFPMFYRPVTGEKLRETEEMKRRLRKWMRPWSIWAEEGA